MTSEKADDFIDLLTSQTFDLAERRSQLVAHTAVLTVHNALENDLISQHISFWHSDFDRDRQTFRLAIGPTVVDFPINWSIFNELHSWIQSGQSSYFQLSRDEDADQLYSIINQMYSAERFYFAVYFGQLVLVADCFPDFRVRELLQEHCCPPLPILVAA